MVNVDNMHKWADALESGRFPRTEGYLTLLDDAGEVVGHCCLGVACELAIEDGVQIYKDTVRTSGKPSYVCYDRAGGFLPDTVARWLGLPREVDVSLVDVESQVPGARVSATCANDALSWDFRRIARAIRATYPRAEQ